VRSGFPVRSTEPHFPGGGGSRVVVFGLSLAVFTVSFSLHPIGETTADATVRPNRKSRSDGMVFLESEWAAASLPRGG
jgi:hypothetical protein